jgi:hypothetical protein
MNRADDYYFRNRRLILPSKRAKLLYNLNPMTFKHQNLEGQLSSQLRKDYLDQLRKDYPDRDFKFS